MTYTKLKRAYEQAQRNTDAVIAEIFGNREER